VLLVAALATGALTTHAADWRAWQLLALLTALAVVSERMTIAVHSLTLSGSFVAMTLAMALLGPGPAVLIGIAIDAIAVAGMATSAKKSFSDRITDQATNATFLVAGALMVRLLVGNVHAAHNPRVLGPVFPIVVFGVFLATNALNFLLIAANKRVMKGRRIRQQIREAFVPMLPSQFAAAALTAIVAGSYVHFGYPVMAGVVVVLVTFQYLAVALLRSEERGEQLRARGVRLASLQLGVLSALMETLNMRDAMTARHAAAVARYAQDLAREVSCSETEQEQAHTAGLLHDVGKFGWPDRVLHSVHLSTEDIALVRRHPLDGAAIVGRLDGYGPIADIILYHHERMDGRGYPAGLIGSEIPLLSRIVAVCETYDTLTANDSYRETCTPQDAFREMRQHAGSQLDAELVEAFIALLTRQGALVKVARESPEFAKELDFDRRAGALADPVLAKGVS
jgi:putative nucleotidyltransferase with HDIG domain